MTRLPRFSRFRRPAIYFTYLLRRAEQYADASGAVGKLLGRYYRSASRRYGMRYGILLPPGVCGPGLFIVRHGCIVVSGHARIGANLRIHAGVNIGENGKGTPSLGNGVYLGPGAKIFGDIHIGDNVRVGANAVVDQSVPGNCVVVGPRASIVKRAGEDALAEGELVKESVQARGDPE